MTTSATALTQWSTRRVVGRGSGFQVVPESKVAKNRLHLDVAAGVSRDAPLPERTAAIRAEADRLVALGATVVRELGDDAIEFFAVTRHDPEGNEFCVH
jgi:hypothetical protein